MLNYDAVLIGCEWALPAGTDVLEVVSPVSEERVGRAPSASRADVDAAVAAAQRAYTNGTLRRMTVDDRGALVLKIGAHLHKRLDDLVHLQIDEMGSPYAFMSRMLEAHLQSLPARVATAAAIDPVERREGTVGPVLVYREPVGVTAGIVPWNAPVALLMSKIVPALLTGCPAIVKPAPETPLSAYAVAEAAIEAGLPPGVLSILPGGREVGEYLVTHPGISRVSFTGSTAAGTRIAALCGERLRSATLELGGKSAAIVLPDADLDKYLTTLVAGSLENNGQVCTATTRILVPRARAAEVTERLVAAISGMRVGDPHDVNTAIGPLVARRQRDRVERYVSIGREEGARVALGGGRPAGLPRGWFVEPTLFTGVSNSMRIAQEEIFGPVLCVIEYGTEDEAIAIANDSCYGLGGAVFSEDVERALRVASRLETGTCQINDAPSSGGGGPFGGVKQSGIGRERGREGFENYYSIKSIALPLGFDVPADVVDR